MITKVSVIIPVYNGEQYITQCIESLISQTLQECEFIFINDGSKDNSKQIIEKYQNLDNRIKLINQENQGVSIARNFGLIEACGEYVGFVDVDDYIDKDMYETLYNAAKESNCDAVISNFESELDGYKVVTQYPFPTDSVLQRGYIEEEILPYLIKSDQLNTACNKIYKNKEIKKYQVKFPDRVVLGEDGLFNINFFRNANLVRYIDYTGYHYREVAGSATRNIEEKDYFKRALEVYTMEIPELYIGNTVKLSIQQLRSIKLITSVMSYIYVYFKSSSEMSLRTRFRYVKNMIQNPFVREALPFYYSEQYNRLGRYEKFITKMIQRESMIGLFCATTYSRLKNKRKGA